MGGGGGEKKKTNKMIDTTYGQSQGDRKGNLDRIQGQQETSDTEMGGSRGTSDTDLDKLRNTNYDVNASKYGGFGGGGVRAGRVDPNKYSLKGSSYAVNPRGFQAKGDFKESSTSFRDFGKTGGIDEGKARVAHPYFQEFAKTGGYSDQDRRNIRSRATSPISALYSGIQDESSRLSNVQGGYGPGRGALKSRLARDSASAVGQTSLDAELGIAERVNEGRRFGASGLDFSEGNIQSTLQRGRMFGASGLQSNEQSMAAISEANQARAAAISQGNMRLAASIDTEINRLKASLEVGNVNREFSAASGNASRGAAGARFAAGLAEGNQNRRFGRDQYVSGMSRNNYENDRNYNFDLQDQNMRAQNNSYNAGLGSANARTNANQGGGRDWLGTIGRGAGAVAGVLGGFGGGGEQEDPRGGRSHQLGDYSVPLRRGTDLGYKPGSGPGGSGFREGDRDWMDKKWKTSGPLKRDR